MNTHQWLSRLIKFDTTSRNSNLDLLDCIGEWLSHHNILFHLIKDPQAPKANLFATLPDHKGNLLHGGLILSGHTDVVPVDGQDWKTSPFEAVLSDDRIFGRGTCDMKGFIAVVLSMVPAFKKIKLSRPLHFAFSYDEEVGCRGAPLMIDWLKKQGIQPETCIVGEPTSMQPVIAHKGIQVFRVSFKGLAAHSSLTTAGCNAIEHAAKLISFVRKIADECRENGPQDQGYDVSFSTLTTNQITGGIAHNVIPADCECYFEFRNLPAVDPDKIITKIKNYIKNEILPLMQKEYSEAKIIIEKIAQAPGFVASDKSQLQDLVCAHSPNPDTRKVAYATEAGLFENAGISSIVCGPGSIEQAHRANEYVTTEQLSACEKFLFDLVSHRC